MAKMKIEFLHHWHRHHGLTLKERLIAYLPRYAPRLRRVAPLINVLQRVGKHFLGIAAKRTLPTWRNEPLPEPASRIGNREVVLFIDTFTRHFEPENARAALRVLEAAGYRVHLADAGPGERPLCCGRTFLAGGLVEEARTEARRMLDALLPHVKRGLTIVGLEPSCLFSLRDEFLSLLPRDAAAQLSQQALLFEEFLLRERTEGRMRLALKPLPQRSALLHGHCHQKAFDVMPAVRKVLEWIPELNVKLVESSCCGMAGAFGYDAKHYEVSMRMAEASLLPAVREADPGTLIVADGTSCRHQIRDGAARNAVHLARVLESALAD